MRFIIGLLLALAWLPSGGATDRTAYLAAVAGVPIHVFDLQAADVSQHFRTFLSEVPMTNNRPLPAALVDDTVASLSFVKAVTAVDEPSYFVAAYIQKTPLVALAQADRARYLLRYGEEVYPQQICPVFLSRANASVPRLLSTAVSLPDVYFEDVAGSAENFDRLFALTEASHCGFIARELANPTVVPRGLSQSEIRTVLEALGDFEATTVFRSSTGDYRGADEADVLFAGRLLAMFLLERENPYTPIPGLLHEYERIGVDAAHRQMDRITASVRLARGAVREALGVHSAYGNALLPLEAVTARLIAAHASGELAVDDALAGELIAALGPAIQLIQGDRTSGPGLRGASAGGNGAERLVTLTGASILN
ncbi:MAG: hypothetical protein WD795_09835 [Woeseia sp.]